MHASDRITALKYDDKFGRGQGVVVVRGGVAGSSIIGSSHSYCGHKVCIMHLSINFLHRVFGQLHRHEALQPKQWLEQRLIDSPREDLRCLTVFTSEKTLKEYPRQQKVIRLRTKTIGSWKGLKHPSTWIEGIETSSSSHFRDLEGANLYGIH
jgi:hypothetical protein